MSGISYYKSSVRFCAWGCCWYRIFK